MYTIKELRDYLEMSNKAFAKTVGIPPSRVSEYVTGARRMSVDVAYKIMQAFDVIASVDFKTKEWKFTPRADD
jgi:plasmid maintenance system antidote protein VapI